MHVYGTTVGFDPRYPGVVMHDADGQGHTLERQTQPAITLK